MKASARSIIKEVARGFGFWRCYRCKTIKSTYSDKHPETVATQEYEDSAGYLKHLVEVVPVCTDCHVHIFDNTLDKIRTSIKGTNRGD